MVLITISDKSYPIEFVYNLRGYFKFNFIQLVDKKRLKTINDYIENTYSIKFDLYSACLEAIETAIINEDDKKYDLLVDPNIKYNEIRLKLLIQLLNDGTLDVEAYPIFKQIEKKISSNLNMYYQMYCLGITV